MKQLTEIAMIEINLGVAIGYWIGVLLFIKFFDKKVQETIFVNYITVYFRNYPALVFVVNSVLFFMTGNIKVLALALLSLIIVGIVAIIFNMHKSSTKNKLEMLLMLRFEKEFRCKVDIKQLNPKSMKWTMYITVYSKGTCPSNEAVQYAKSCVNPEKYEVFVF